MTEGTRSKPSHLWRVVLAAILLVPGALGAEVYLAATEGYRCSQCHVNLTGGGMRTEFGAIFSSTHLPLWVPERENDSAAARFFQTGNLGPVRLGTNLRASWNAVRPDDDDEEDTNEFELNAANLYLEATVFREMVTFYVDESFAPGGASNREAFALLRFPFRKNDKSKGNWWVKAGKFFPPFGLRVLDDETLTRAATGFSFTNSDQGVEVGFLPPNWEIALSLTNGTQGAPESNSQKMVSAIAEYVRKRWRLGFSYAHNTGDVIKRDAFGIHGTARFGKVVLIAEVDLVKDAFEDDQDRPDVDKLAGFIEGRVWLTRGQNLRLTWDVLDPDRDIATDTRERITVGYEGFLLPGLQVRANATFRDGPPQTAGARDDSLALELHLFF